MPITHTFCAVCRVVCTTGPVRHGEAGAAPHKRADKDGHLREQGARFFHLCESPFQLGHTHSHTPLFTPLHFNTHTHSPYNSHTLLRQK